MEFIENTSANKLYSKNRSRACPLSVPGAPSVNYKNPKFLVKFISERGRILPRRITGISAKKQRELKIAIKRARILALLPIANS